MKTTSFGDYRSNTSDRNFRLLEQRVFDFEKRAKQIVQRLENTKQKIEKCFEGER